MVMKRKNNVLEMMPMELMQVKVSETRASRIPGYHRAAYAVLDCYGVRSRGGEVETNCLFALVLHKKMTFPYDVLVEVLCKPDGEWQECCNDAIPLSVDLWKRVCGGHDAIKNLLEAVDGRMYIRGLAQSTGYIHGKPSRHMCKCSNAYQFILKFGAAFASALKLNEKVHDLAEGIEFNDAINKVNQFVVEMEGKGVNSDSIISIQKSIAFYIEELKRDEARISKGWECRRRAEETLARYGLTCDY